MTIKQSIVVNTIRLWVPIAVAATLLCGLLYITIQQTERYNADFPQIHLAADIASRLGNNQDATQVVTGSPIDIAHDSSSYVIVYDISGNVLASTGHLNGQTPKVPQGALEYAQQNGEHRVTWEPQKGVRSAIVIRHYNGIPSGFVVVGRSLQPTELLTNQLRMIITMGLFIILGSVFLAANAGALLAEWAQRSVISRNK